MSAPVSVGEQFRLRRDERGLSIEQAAFQSKVPLRLVQALESDDYRLFPDPGYLARHLYDYATFLQLDPDSLQAGFRDISRRPPIASVSSPTPRLPVSIGWKQVCWTIAVLLLVTPLVFIVLSLASKRAADREAERPEAAREEAVAESSNLLADRVLRDDAVASASLPSVVSASGQPGPVGDRAMPPATTAEPSSVGPPVGPHLLVIEAREATWISVQVDGRDRKQVLLKPGDATKFSAQERLQLTVGNAGGITLTFDGKPLPALGPSGAVIRDFVLPVPDAPAVTPGRSAARP